MPKSAIFVVGLWANLAILRSTSHARSRQYHHTLGSRAKCVNVWRLLWPRGQTVPVARHLVILGYIIDVIIPRLLKSAIVLIFWLMAKCDYHYVAVIGISRLVGMCSLTKHPLPRDLSLPSPMLSLHYHHTSGIGDSRLLFEKWYSWCHSNSRVWPSLVGNRGIHCAEHNESPSHAGVHGD